MAVERKYERDIDLLLAEEFSVNAEFAEWMKTKTAMARSEARVADVLVSKSDNLGESDLIVVYEYADGGKFALMIEDKVDAPLQPEQAARYRLRAEREVQLGLCATFEVWLFAPRHYVERCTSIAGFDGAVTFEEIADFLRRNTSSARHRYRAEFLETAAVRRANNWVRQSDDATNEFWEAAYKLAASKFPILEMKRLNVTKDSRWITLRPADMPTQPKRIYLSFKGDRGQMDLTFSNVQAHSFSEMIEHVLEPDMTVHQTAASAAIRLEVQGFTISDGLDACLARVEKAFEASERLIRFFRHHRAVLENAAEACQAPPTRRH
jgi:hypothetical protein